MRRFVNCLRVALSTAARCWESGIKGTMAGKTRVLVVNSQMLQRFASDSAVDRSVCDWSIWFPLDQACMTQIYIQF